MYNLLIGDGRFHPRNHPNLKMDGFNFRKVPVGPLPLTY